MLLDQPYEHVPLASRAIHLQVRLWVFETRLKQLHEVLTVLKRNQLDKVILVFRCIQPLDHGLMHLPQREEVMQGLRRVAGKIEDPATCLASCVTQRDHQGICHRLAEHGQQPWVTLQVQALTVLGIRHLGQRLTHLLVHFTLNHCQLSS
ncbi:hypothetical protein D3C80_1394370 [compost metagenome]